MKLLKNGVGRPSNETLRKRKIFYITIAVATIIIVGVAGFTLYRYATGINGIERNASVSNCRMPYSTSKCKYARNSTIKKVQKMLNTLGYYKKLYGFDGNFGPKTVAAIKDFQNDYGLDADGYIGPETLEELAKATDTDYFKVKYDKNGGSGTLNSQYGNMQTIIKGVSTPISSTELTKSGKKHVGYTGTTTINGVEYKYGCFTANCVSGKQSRYSVTAIKNKEKSGSTFYNYVYPVGANLKNTAKDGQTVTMTAFYCSTGETYNQKTSKCVKSSTTSSSGSYNYTGSMTGYSVKCSGCDGRGYVACYDVMPSAKKKRFTTSDYKYKDSTYGTVRVVAMSSSYPCGTIIEIQNYKEGISTKKAVRAIVLDRGVSGNSIDLLVSTNNYATNYIGRQSVNFKILRNGW